MKFVSLFTGAGGLDIGFENAGFESQGFVEFWKPAIETMMANRHKVRLIKKDIRDLNAGDLDGMEADVVIGGPPRQGFSMAGKRNKGDKRNTLFMEYLKVVDVLKPKACVMENVKGIWTMQDENGKHVFNKIIEEFGKRGYEVKAKLLNSANYEVPQKRERVIFVAWNNGKDYEFPEPAKRKKYLKDVLDLPYEAIEEVQHVYFKSNSFFKKAYYLKQGQAISSFGSAGSKLKWDFAPTITKTGRYIHPKHPRMISVREAARIQTFPDSWKFCGSMDDMYGQIGNAVPVKMAEAVAETIKKLLE